MRWVEYPQGERAWLVRGGRQAFHFHNENEARWARSGSSIRREGERLRQSHSRFPPSPSLNGTKLPLRRKTEGEESRLDFYSQDDDCRLLNGPENNIKPRRGSLTVFASEQRGQCFYDICNNQEDFGHHLARM